MKRDSLMGSETAMIVRRAVVAPRGGLHYMKRDSLVGSETAMEMCIRDR